MERQPAPKGTEVVYAGISCFLAARRTKKRYRAIRCTLFLELRNPPRQGDGIPDPEAPEKKTAWLQTPQAAAPQAETAESHGHRDDRDARRLVAIPWVSEVLQGR